MTPVDMTPRYVDETTVLGKCQECKEFESEVVSNFTKAPSFVFFIQPFDSPGKKTISPQVVLKPCQHVPVCPTCSPKISSCPQCGAQVEEKSIKHGHLLNCSISTFIVLRTSDKNIARIANAVQVTL